MAEKRMISRKISSSVKWNKLSSFGPKTLFILLVVHADDFGRLDGDAPTIRLEVLPGCKGLSDDDVEKMLEEIRAVGLILRAEIHGKMVINIVNFDEHQTGLHRRTKSRYPEIPGNSRKFPEIPLNERCDVMGCDVKQNERCDVNDVKTPSIVSPKPENRKDKPKSGRINPLAPPPPDALGMDGTADQAKKLLDELEGK